MKFNIAIATLLASFGLANAACPNQCSGHGDCGPHDMCTCDRNWQGADCSLRTCPFGRAHVDTPKGDLDASLSVEPYSTLVLEGSTVYPYGTSEAFPLMEDTAGNHMDDSAHDYMECSNKGLCDRAKGQCECLPGYDGAACQRASCPSKANSNTPGSGQGLSNVAFKVFTGKSSFNGRAMTIPQVGQCSGHGTCMTNEQLAFLDHGNSYGLWDKHSTMGCKCDPGYTGADCSERTCVHGVDPLYIDDTSTRVTHTTVRIESSDSNALSGEYAIRFWDTSGEDFTTKGIPVTGDGIVDGASKTHCDAVREALLELPNSVVPSIECSQAVINTDKGVEYTLKFVGNPGKLREIEIDQFLDGSRSTVGVSIGTMTMGVHTKVVGESVDYFAERCEGITVKVLADSSTVDDTWILDNVRPGSLGYLSGPEGPLTASEMKILKKCLGDSDWDPDNNVEVADWDYGVVVENDGVDSHNMIGAHPHAIKVVPISDDVHYTTTTPGSYHLLWFDEDATTGKEFRVANLNSDANEVSEATEMYVYTTKGTVQQMGYGTEPRIADNSSGTASSTRIVGFFDKDTNRIYTNYDTSCQTNAGNNHRCVEKGDKLFVVDSCWGKGELGVGAASPNSIFGGTTLNACADSTIPNKDSGNIYTVTKVYTTAPNAESANAASDEIDVTSDVTLKRYVNTNIIEVDASFGWQGLKGDPENSNSAGDDTTWSDNTGVVVLFHFTPHNDGTYEAVSECSNRGNCDRESALCKCFTGYTSYDCSEQNILALSDEDKAAKLNKKKTS